MALFLTVLFWNFLLLLCVWIFYLHVCLYHMCAVSVKARRGHQIPGTGVTDASCCCVAVGSWAQVLWESSKGSESRSPRSSPWTTSFRMPTHSSCDGCCNYLVLLFTNTCMVGVGGDPFRCFLGTSARIPVGYLTRAITGVNHFF